MNRRGFLAGAVGAAVAPVVPAAPEVLRATTGPFVIKEVTWGSPCEFLSDELLKKDVITFEAHWVSENIDPGWLHKFGHLHGYEKDGSGI